MSNYYRRIVSANKPVAAISATNAFFNITDEFNAKKSGNWPTKFPADLFLIGGGGGGTTAYPGLHYGPGGNGGNILSTSTILYPGLYNITAGLGGSGGPSNGSPSIISGVTVNSYVQQANGGNVDYAAHGDGSNHINLGSQTSGDSGGNGGTGLTTTIISTALATLLGVGEVSGGQVYFGGGGGSPYVTWNTSVGRGGVGGGGFSRGYQQIDYSASGAPNTGGGGGGNNDAAVGGGYYPGAAGGNGVVIIRVPDYIPIAKATNLYLYRGAPYSTGYTTYIWTGNGTINFY